MQEPFDAPPLTLPSPPSTARLRSPQAGERVKLAVLVSGSGTTLQNLIDVIRDGQLHAEVRIVIGSREGLKGVERASAAGIMNFVVDRKAFDDCASFSKQVFGLIDDAGADLVCLGGWLCLLDIPDRYLG